MKKNLTLRILTLVAALLVAVMTLASCSADSPVGDMAPGLGPADQNTAGGMEGGDGASNIGGGQPTDNRKIIRTVTMSCETKAYDDAVTVIMTALNTHGGYVEASISTGSGYVDV